MNLSRPSIPPLTNVYSSAREAWLELLSDVISHGAKVQPRGRKTRELLASSKTFDMRFPVVNPRGRRLGYRFMCAEAAWILEGRDDVAGLAPYGEVSRFSDDGVKFFGAYGPKVLGQLAYVAKTLVDDRDSRQAVMNIWRENPPQTKDVPCTLNLQFLVRDDALHTIANMRSSDTWLGWVYDVFTFTMVSAAVLNRVVKQGRVPTKLGNLTLRAGSQHLYEDDLDKAVRCLSYENQEPEGDIHALNPFSFDGREDQVRQLWLAANAIDTKEVDKKLECVTLHNVALCRLSRGDKA